MAITINFEIKGNKEITDVYSTETLTLKGKVEQIISGAVVSDGDIAIDFARVGTVSKIIIESDDCYLKIGPLGDIRTLPISGMFIYSVFKDFADTMDVLSVGTTNTQATDIKITVLGV